MALSDDDVREILAIIDESPLQELRIETAGFSLHVLRGAVQTAGTDPSVPVTAPLAPPAKLSDADLEIEQESGGERLSAIEAPMLGTFYRAEGPGQAPFVEIGTRVAADTTVCIIEVMKMMNSVPAGVSGTIVEVCSESGQMVEYGQPLFRIRAS